LDPAVVHHLVAEIPAELLGSPQINILSVNGRKLSLHSGDRQQARCFAREKLYDQVYVAFGAILPSQGRAVEGELSHVVTPAKFRELRCEA
jgi:hypothetical protein